MRSHVIAYMYIYIFVALVMNNPLENVLPSEKISDHHFVQNGAFFLSIYRSYAKNFRHQS